MLPAATKTFSSPGWKAIDVIRDVLVLAIISGFNVSFETIFLNLKKE